MDVDTLRFLDRFIALPLCQIFTFARWLAWQAYRHKTLPAPHKVLIVKLSEMGSTVLAYPALLELKKRSPGVELYFLVFNNNAEIINVLNLAPSSNIVTIDIKSIRRLLTSGLAAIRRLLREHIDTTIDMDFFSRFTVLVSFLICRGNRVGHHAYTNEGLNRGNLLTHRVIYNHHVHTSVAYMSLIRTLFEVPDDEPHYRGRIDPDDLILPSYGPSSGDVMRIRNKLERAGMVGRDDQTIILINPNSSDLFPLRKWPIDYFAQLCVKILIEIPSCWQIITGVASERADAQFIQKRVSNPRCIDFTGKTDLRELLALYSIASLMVTNDSGPAHFASLLRLPTVVLFGPETPRLYSPMGNNHKNLYANYACSPCVSVYNAKKSSCKENRCLKAITVDEVLKEVLVYTSAFNPIRLSTPKA